MCDEVIAVGGDQGHDLVNWNDSGFERENEHLSSDGSFDFRSPDKSYSKKIKLSPQVHLILFSFVFFTISLRVGVVYLFPNRTTLSCFRDPHTKKGFPDVQNFCSGILQRFFFPFWICNSYQTSQSWVVFVLVLVVMFLLVC